MALIEARKVRVDPELDLAAVRLRAAGDEVHHRALAGAVGADDHPQFTGIHVKIQIGDGLETVEGLVDVFEGQDKFFSAHAHLVLAISGLDSLAVTGAAVGLGRKRSRRERNCSGNPTIPLGINTVTRMNSVPKISSHISG